MNTWALAGIAGIVSAAPLATIPNDCSSGSLLVSQGNGVFTCSAPSRAVQISNCQAGDFIVTSGSELRCERPSSTTWNVKALLPQCSSGDVLVSEGFGSWKCTSKMSLLPSCSSGEVLVSDGSSSGFRCKSLLPSCSSGEILMSEGYGSWKCGHLPSK